MRTKKRNIERKGEKEKIKKWSIKSILQILNKDPPLFYKNPTNENPNPTKPHMVKNKVEGHI